MACLFAFNLHLKAWLEDDDFPGWNGYDLSRARVSSGAALAFLDLKNSEITQFNLFAAAQRLDHMIECLLHDLLNISLLQFCFVSYLQNNIFFSHQSLLVFQDNTRASPMNAG
jgi:hypothetical protein